MVYAIIAWLALLTYGGFRLYKEVKAGFYLHSLLYKQVEEIEERIPE